MGKPGTPFEDVVFNDKDGNLGSNVRITGTYS